MEGYLGEFPVTVEKTPHEWALLYITKYGGTDGEHHKTWVIDQVARILNGTPVVTKEARWSNGQRELRFDTGKPTKAYRKFVAAAKRGEDGPDTYGYDEGIPP